jgi:hypothetical protein
MPRSTVYQRNAVLAMNTFGFTVMFAVWVVFAIIGIAIDGLASREDILQRLGANTRAQLRHSLCSQTNTTVLESWGLLVAACPRTAVAADDNIRTTATFKPASNVTPLITASS